MDSWPNITGGDNSHMPAVRKGGFGDSGVELQKRLSLSPFFALERPDRNQIAFLLCFVILVFTGRTAFHLVRPV